MTCNNNCFNPCRNYPTGSLNDYNICINKYNYNDSCFVPYTYPYIPNCQPCIPNCQPCLSNCQPCIPNCQPQQQFCQQKPICQSLNFSSNPTSVSVPSDICVPIIPPLNTQTLIVPGIGPFSSILVTSGSVVNITGTLSTVVPPGITQTILGFPITGQAPNGTVVTTTITPSGAQVSTNQGVIGVVSGPALLEISQNGANLVINNASGQLSTGTIRPVVFTITTGTTPTVIGGVTIPANTTAIVNITTTQQTITIGQTVFPITAFSFLPGIGTTFVNGGTVTPINSTGTINLTLGTAGTVTNTTIEGVPVTLNGLTPATLTIGPTSAVLNVNGVNIPITSGIVLSNGPNGASITIGNTTIPILSGVFLNINGSITVLIPPLPTPTCTVTQTPVRLTGMAQCFSLNSSGQLLISVQGQYNIFANAIFQENANGTRTIYIYKIDASGNQILLSTNTINASATGTTNVSTTTSAFLNTCDRIYVAVSQNSNNNTGSGGTTLTATVNLNINLINC